MSTLHLNKLLDPESLVFVGASAREGSSGFTLTQNLITGGFKGRLYLVNPRYASVLDTPCYKSIKHLPETPDLALIMTPVRLLRRSLAQCARKGIKVAMVMSGTSKSQDLHRYAKRLGMRLVGPYCAGIIRPHLGLNASFSENRIHKGSLAIVSQSASIASAMLDWAETTHVGFSALLSTGDDTDTSLADLLDLLAEDWQTRAVIVYVERVKRSRSLLSALSATARIKPVVLMRSAHESAYHCDVLTRTGQTYSSDAVFQAALNRAGVVRIRTYHNLFASAKIISTRVRVQGDRLAIISNGNAPAMMAMERMHAKQFKVPQLNMPTLNKTLKGQFTGLNPLVLRNPQKLGDHIALAIEHLQTQDDIDAILVIFTPDARNCPDALAEQVTRCMPSTKTLLACWMGEASVSLARDTLAKGGIPTFRTPEAAVDGFDFLHRYFVSQQQLLQLPNPTSRTTQADIQGAQALVSEGIRQGERVLNPTSTHKLLKLMDINVLPSIHASTLPDAVAAASQIGYPVAVKLVSDNVGFKESVVCTQLGIQSAEALSDAWHSIKDGLHQQRQEAEFQGVIVQAMHSPKNSRNLTVSITRDATFGPVISLGIGGELTALVSERSVQLPPLNRFLVQELLNTDTIQTYMGAFRHSQALDPKPVGAVLRRLSEVACELPDVYSLEINPLIVDSEGAVAQDTHIVLQSSPTTKRYAHLAIHPYPWHWIRNITLKGDRSVQLRPIRPEDATSIMSLVKNMSAESRYFRFMHAINELSPQMVAQFTKLDYNRQMALVATSDDKQIVGVCRYMISNDRRSGEFAISISEDWKGVGLASSLMKLLIEHAREQGLETLQGDVLRTNTPMQALMSSLGFIAKRNPDDADVIQYVYALRTPQ